jgi:general secretion pathway protein A
MYIESFGLQKSPFNLTPDPEFIYLTEQNREVLAGLTYAMLARKGFVLLTGNAGTGKTTLLKRILEHLPASRIQSSVIVNPTLTAPEFLEAVLLDFGLTDIPASKAQRIGILQNFLWKGHREGKVSALIVDEAHKLSMELLEEIRLLGNFESANEKLLQVALIGQTELDDLLKQEKLRQFKQRISLRLTIEPLGRDEVARYIQFRWVKAGGVTAPFSADALAGIGEASQAIPRVINLLCENALLLAFSEGAASVELRHVLTVCRELQFDAPAITPSLPVEQSAREMDTGIFFPVAETEHAVREQELVDVVPGNGKTIAETKPDSAIPGLEPAGLEPAPQHAPTHLAATTTEAVPQFRYAMAEDDGEGMGEPGDCFADREMGAFHQESLRLPPASEGFSLNGLESYGAKPRRWRLRIVAPKRSWLARLAVHVRFMQRIESA